MRNFHNRKAGTGKINSSLRSLIYFAEYAEIIEEMKRELARIMDEAGNTMSLDELRTITDTDFGSVN